MSYLYNVLLKFNHGKYDYLYNYVTEIKIV